MNTTRMLVAMAMLVALPVGAQSLVPSYNTADPSAASGGTFPRNFAPTIRQLRPYQVNITLAADLQDVQDALPLGWVALPNAADAAGRTRITIDVNVGRRRVRENVVEGSAVLAVFTLARSPTGRTERVLMGLWEDNVAVAAVDNGLVGSGSIRVPDSFVWEVSQKNGTQRLRARAKERQSGLDFALEVTAPDDVGVLTTVDNNPPLVFRFADGHTATHAQYLATRYYKLPVVTLDLRTETSGEGAGVLGLPGGPITVYEPFAALAEYRVFAENGTQIIP